jgi:hypothetical protein
MCIVDKIGNIITTESPEYKAIATEFGKIFLEQEKFDFDSDTDYLEYFLDWYECKWYSHDEDMEKISTLFADYRFALEGQGEERNDWWVAYWENGIHHSSCAEIVAPQFPKWFE